MKHHYVNPEKGTITLPNGCTLYWKRNTAGGRSYFSDEVGGGAPVWETALIDEATLMAAIVQEKTLVYYELMKKEGRVK